MNIRFHANAVLIIIIDFNFIIDNNYLSLILKMADEMWDDPTSSHGRKTGAKETTTHVSIHTLHLDGLRELYRHFLKLPDGAIVEVHTFLY